MSSQVSGLTHGSSRDPRVAGQDAARNQQSTSPLEREKQIQGDEFVLFPRKGLDLEVSRWVLHVPESQPTLTAPGCCFWVVFS